ncbi:hypothetical protein BBP40_005495 [Aspergillus hancockii]|nr:hypothetical protein BBP40_005495 [Aspergillus hancockii]
MLLSTLSVTILWVGSCAATRPPSVETDLLNTSNCPKSHSSDLHGSSHDIHLPCAGSAICGNNIEGNTSPNDHLILTFSADNDSLMVNNNTILPASLPMRLTAVKRSADASLTPEYITLRYGMNILPVQRSKKSPIADQFLMNIRLFDQLGYPATTDIISITLTRDPQDTIEITLIKIGPDSPKSPDHTNAGSVTKPSTKLRQALESTEHAMNGHLLCSMSRAHNWVRNKARSYGIRHGMFASLFKSQTCGSHCIHRDIPEHRVTDRYAHRRNPVVDFVVRFVYPAILPFFLAVVAGGVTCALGVMLCKFSLRPGLSCLASTGQQYEPAHTQSARRARGNRPQPRFISQRLAPVQFEELLRTVVL